MVTCKFYRQGNCRYGQYCQYEHVNHFGNTKIDYNNIDEIADLVAKEVLIAEKGGQWLLSCFAPMRERSNIPGMEDISPEEIRWEIYQSQKNGMIEQAKLHFQQLCQDMKEKREALKNPNQETVAMLRKLLGTQKSGLNGNTAGKSSNFFAAPQLNLPTNNVFGKQTFGIQNNPFGGGFSSSNNVSIFGRPNNNVNPMFGGTPTFGNSLGFGAAMNNNSLFGGTTNTSTFNNVQNTPAFGAPQTTPIFGGSSQSVFGQSNVFGATNQLTSQSTTSAFDNGATSSTSFNNPMTSQANVSLFGSAPTTTTNLFGGSLSVQTNPVFGTTTSSSPFSTRIFSQPKTLPAFGGAPVFGGVTNYANNSGSLFGNTTQAFGAAPISNNVFGGSAVATTPAFGASVVTTAPAFGTSVVTTAPAFGAANTTLSFGALAATTTPTLGASVATTTPAFGLGQQSTANTFGATVCTPNVFGTQSTGVIMSASNTTPFGQPITTISSPFITASSQFGSTNTTSTPFAGAGFGLAAGSTNDTFGTAATSSNSIFADTGSTFTSSNTIMSNPSPFSASTFGNLNASPFGATSTAITPTTITTTSTSATTTIVNPFAPRTQQSNTPFGNIVQPNIISTSSPFGNSLNVNVITTVIDDSVYTTEDALTDDEKSMYLAEKFIIGKIPLKPPTKDIR